MQTASYEERLKRALGESRRDFEEGRSYSSREEMLAAVAAKREAKEGRCGSVIRA